MTGGFGVGAVGQQGQHPGIAQCLQAGGIGQFPIHRGGVNLKITGVDDGPGGGGDGQRRRIDNGVGDPDKLHRKRPGTGMPARLDRPKTDHLVQVVFPELGLDQRQGHGGAEQGDVNLTQ